MGPIRPRNYLIHGNHTRTSPSSPIPRPSLRQCLNPTAAPATGAGTIATNSKIAGTNRIPRHSQKIRLSVPVRLRRLAPGGFRLVQLLMGLRIIRLSFPLLLATAVAGQQGEPASEPAPLVQPGAPGQKSKTVTVSSAGTPYHGPTDADTSFMQGMIMHHSQAVEMVDLLRTRGASKELQALGDRISISQTDEIKYMKQWLEDRGKPTSMPMQHDMKGMEGMDMSMSMPLMPGMLSPQQMKDLAAARGPAFDHLFLTGMIQHHTGALTMVDELYSTPGAAQDSILYDFATDIDNTQRAEIRIMQAMLDKEKLDKEKK